MLPPSKVTPFRIGFAKKASGLILDCACGTGEFHRYLDGENIVSLDQSLSQLDKVRDKRICSDATCPPFKDNTFDTLWACGLIHYINKSFIEYFPEWKRIVKPDGKIFILTPNKHSPFNFFCAITGNKSWKNRESIVKLYSVQELQKFGKVFGEVQFFPVLNCIARKFPQLGHTLMVEIHVQK